MSTPEPNTGSLRGWTPAQPTTFTPRRRRCVSHDSTVLRSGGFTDSGRSVAFWGATGKGSAFLNIFDLFDHAWPVVVDSDYNKVGRFVPRTGQEIHPPEYLVENPVDTIVITTQWRAEDIAWEIQNRRIPCREILVLVGQELQPLNGRGDGGR